jgi:hypothetical protein
MNKEFVTYEQALALKELGFDEPCFGSYDPFGSKQLSCSGIYTYGNCIAAPLYQQAFRWFREKYGHYYEIFVDDDKTFGFLISYFVEAGRGDKPIQRKYVTHEEAELECLKKLIQLAK